MDEHFLPQTQPLSHEQASSDSSVWSDCLSLLIANDTSNTKLMGSYITMFPISLRNLNLIQLSQCFVENVFDMS